jgi:calcineurin-like phosphoesterase family protein
VRHLVIPDVQLRPGVPTQHLDWIRQYVIEKKPDVLVIIGDWADMASLSSYDIGKKSFEGRNYRDDILVANDALQRFMAPIEEEQKRLIHDKKKRWNLRKVITLGNHENRINIAIENDRKLEGLISTDDLLFAQFGFEVYPFLKPVTIDGVAYCHYFVSGVMGRPVTTARALLTKHHMSCFAGHQQDRDIAYGKRADGTRLTAIIAGSCYLHDEGYLNAQTNEHWRGVFMLNEVKDGAFDEMPVSLRFLEEKYAKGRLDQKVPLPLPDSSQ